MYDAKLLEQMANSWYTLSDTKKIESITVYSKTNKEDLSPESLLDPTIKEQVERLGYSGAVFEQSNLAIKAMNLLTDLGYLEKRNETIYYVQYIYEAFPYVPYVSPFGWVGTTSDNKFVISNVRVSSRNIKTFTDSADELKNQISKNMHKHITKFDYGISFSYDTIVYEIKDKYFDAIMLDYSQKDQKLIVYTIEPEIASDDEKDRKIIKKLSQLDPEIFLSGSEEFDKIMEVPKWKEKSKGIIINDNKAYYLVNKIEDIPKKDGLFSKRPNFFDGGVASQENFLSRIFEDAIANNLSTKYGYKTQCRIKPAYLNGKEIDIFAEKGSNPVEITICECKLRFKDAPLTMNELSYFHQKILKIAENERKRGTVTFHFQFVSNTGKLEEGVKEFAKNENIQIKKVQMPNNWKGRSDWAISTIQDV